MDRGTKMNNAQNYANQWDVSAQFFYEKGYYSWMAQRINKFQTVVEVGCGTGYSTLALVENGHKVIAIDKNRDCIAKAKQLLLNRGIAEDSVIFVEGDIVEDSFRSRITSTFEFDVVLCWNVGSYWSKEMIEYYLPYMLEYGLNRFQIVQNPESSYSELILWETCRLAKAKQVAVHIVDRGAETLNEQNDPYYKILKDEFGYKEIIYANQNALTISKGGRMLATNGVVNTENFLDIVFVSILMQ